MRNFIATAASGAAMILFSFSAASAGSGQAGAAGKVVIETARRLHSGDTASACGGGASTSMNSARKAWVIASATAKSAVDAPATASACGGGASTSMSLARKAKAIANAIVRSAVDAPATASA